MEYNIEINPKTGLAKLPFGYHFKMVVRDHGSPYLELRKYWFIKKWHRFIDTPIVKDNVVSLSMSLAEDLQQANSKVEKKDEPVNDEMYLDAEALPPLGEGFSWRYSEYCHSLAIVKRGEKDVVIRHEYGINGLDLKKLQNGTYVENDYVSRIVKALYNVYAVYTDKHGLVGWYEMPDNKKVRYRVSVDQIGGGTYLVELRSGFKKISTGYVYSDEDVCKSVHDTADKLYSKYLQREADKKFAGNYPPKSLN